MKYIQFLFCCLFLLPLCSTAQYTEMINTNRPGVSQGAFSVGTNVLQFETGFSYGNEKHDLLGTDYTTFGWDYSVRYGVWREELEVSIIGDFRSNSGDITRGSLTVEDKFSNFRSNTIGAKYLVFDPYRKRDLEGPNLYSWKANNRIQWRDLIPAVSLYAGANFDFADNRYTPSAEAEISPKVVLSTQNNFVGGFVFVTNIIADRITTDFPTYGYILTLTHATNRYFSVFLENQGFKSDFYADQILRGGAAVLLSNHLHVDLSGALNFKDTPSFWEARVGVAYRLDMHEKDEFIEEKGKSGREKRRAEKGKKKAEKKKNKRKDGFIEEDDGGDGDGGLN
ncbi:transporter [Marinirhabdus gelatinilytica]|uniref:Outer membrane putative beta-barrel porin/alpha-amylase n=1 Tax=Marinirhabdus gelatinilytica TaxID=1703343 RepID=A0A370QAL3_9FLAO|nr:transporter [Marinirhabdus gelatinilytica]RDK85418.1 outer membrane putative beta-barrel porin/alpha-amylase [Marinirhabdus gelatinilytica]